MILIIPMAGHGRRMKAVSKVLPKELLPLSANLVDGFYDCALARIVATGRSVGATAIIASTNGGHLVSEALRALAVDEVVSAPLGEAHAVSETANGRDRGESALIWSADNLVSTGDVSRMIERAHNATPSTVVVGVCHKSNLSRFTSVETRADSDAIVELVEKPAHHKAGLAKSGVYVMDIEALHSCFSRRAADRFGEWSMTEALRTGLRSGVSIRAHVLIDGFRDIGTPEEYEAARSCHP